MNDYDRQPIQDLSSLDLNQEDELAFVKGVVNGFLLATPIWLIIYIIVRWIFF